MSLLFSSGILGRGCRVGGWVCLLCIGRTSFWFWLLRIPILLVDGFLCGFSSRSSCGSVVDDDECGGGEGEEDCDSCEDLFGSGLVVEFCSNNICFVG